MKTKDSIPALRTRRSTKKYTRLTGIVKKVLSGHTKVNKGEAAPQDNTVTQSCAPICTFDRNISMGWLSSESAREGVKKSTEKGSSKQPSASDRRFQAVRRKPGTTNQKPRRSSKTKRKRRTESSRTIGTWPGKEQNIKGSEQRAAKNASTNYAGGRTAREDFTHSSNLAGMSSSKRSTSSYEQKKLCMSEANTANKESILACAASRKKERVELKAEASTQGCPTGPAERTQDASRLQEGVRS